VVRPTQLRHALEALRTSSGSKVYALLHSAKAWFEIDAFDLAGRRIRPGPPHNVAVPTDAGGLTGTEPSAPSL
jgi:hypothetical protein